MMLVTAAFLFTLGLSGCSSSDDARTGPARYRWSGLVWGSTENDDAIACFDKVMPSNPPAGCTGWPLSGFDWSTAPGVQDFTTPHANTPVAPIRTASVTIVGHISGAFFVLDRSPTPVDWSKPLAPACNDLMGQQGPAVSMYTASEIVATGQREGRVWLTTPDGGGSLGAANFGRPDPLFMTVLINDEATRAWVETYLTGIRIHLCGLLHPA